MPREIKVHVTTEQKGKGLTDTEKAVNKLHGALDRFGPAGSKVADLLGKLGFSSVGAATAVTGVAAAIAVGVKVAEDAIHQYTTLGEAVRQYSQLTGQSAEESTRQVFALQELGVNVDVASAGMYKLGKAIETSEPKLTKLGITVARNKDGTVDMNATLLNLMNLYQSTGDAAKRTEILFAAFGKAGAAMIPVLEANTAEMQRLEKQVQIVFTQADLDAIRKYEIAQKELKQSNDDLGLSIGRALLPAQTALVTSMNENIYVSEHLDEQLAKMGATHSQNRAAIMEADKALRKEYETALAARTAIDTLAASQQAAAEAAQQEADAENALYDALNKTVDANQAYRQALIDAADAHKANIAVGGKDAETELRVEEAYYKVGVAAVAKKEAEAEANGVSLDTYQKAQAQIQAYKDLEKGLDKNSPLYKALQGYIALLNKIPKDVNTTVSISSSASTAAARDKNTHGGAIGGYADGGMVPGPAGSPQLAIVHGGEEVIPVGAGPQGGRAGVTVVIQGGIFLDHGPSIDKLTSLIAQRLRAVPGR